MKPFRFRLATLQRLREQVRDQRRARLAEAFEAEAALAKRIAHLEEEKEQLREQGKEDIAPGAIVVDRLIEMQRYALVLAVEEKTITQQREMLEQEIETRREAVVEADREVRVLEKLHDRQREQHEREQLRQEFKELDETAVQRAAMKGLK